MSDISIFMTNWDAGSNGQLKLIGQARLSGSDQIDWETQVNYNALASTINTAMKDAAIAAAELAGFTIGALDKKTLYAGAVGL